MSDSNKEIDRQLADLHRQVAQLYAQISDLLNEKSKLADPLKEYVPPLKYNSYTKPFDSPTRCHVCGMVFERNVAYGFACGRANCPSGVTLINRENWDAPPDGGITC